MVTYWIVTKISKHKCIVKSCVNISIYTKNNMTSFSVLGIFYRYKSTAIEFCKQYPDSLG